MIGRTTRLLGFLGLLWAGPAWAATYYVDGASLGGTCNDGNLGTTEGGPWCTMQRAMQSTIVAGDTVWVKTATYTISSATGFRPLNGGTVNAPIAYRAFTPVGSARHTPTLSNTSAEPTTNATAAVSPNTDYTIWDGFTLGAFDMLRVDGASEADKTVGTIIENMTIPMGAISPGPPPPVGSCGNNNYAGIWLQLASATTIRNTTVRDAKYVGCTALNAVGVLLYDSDTTTVVNNEIIDSHVGVADKEGSESTVVALNYIHAAGLSGVSSVGINVQGFDTTRCDPIPECPVTGLRYRYNVFENVTTGVNFNVYDTANVDADFDVYNNTFYNVVVAVTGAPGHGFIVSDVDIYNNIIVTSGAGSYAQLTFSNAIPSDFASNFNLHRALAGTVRFSTPSGLETLSVWQARGANNYDDDSLTSDPLFVGSPANTPQYYALQGGSPAVNAGRIGGVSGGAVVNIGAYATGTEVIGREVVGVSGIAAPTNLAALDTASDTGGSVTLTWTVSTSAGITAQHLYRATAAGGPYAAVTTFANNTTATYVNNSGLTNGVTYYYVIRSYNGTIESANSNQSAAIPVDNSPPLAAPTALSAVNSTNSTGSVTLTWTPSITQTATQQRIYRSPTSGSGYTLLVTYANNTTALHIDTGLTNGTTYYYIVRSWDGSTESANSNQVSAAPALTRAVIDPRATSSRDAAGTRPPVTR